jgi:heat shock protein HslJ
LVRLALAVLAALLPVGADTGCGADDDDPGDPSSLESTPWVLTSGVDVDGWVDVAPSIRFEAGKFGGSTGCNRYGGSYTVDGDALDLGDVGSTLIACPPPADAVERAYLDALERVERWDTDNDALVLLDDEETELLRYAAATPVGSWEGTSFFRDDAVSSPIAGTTITATFDDEGGLTGSAGCNTYTSGYTTDEATIAIEPPAATRKLCSEPPGVMQQEAAYLAALEEAERFGVGGGSLELLRADGTIVANFRRPE